MAVASAALVVIGSVVTFVAVTAFQDLTILRNGALILLAIAATGMVAVVPMRSALLRRQQDEIRDHEERFQLLVEQSPAVVYIDALDESASTLYISPRVEQLTGYSAEEWRDDDNLWPKLLHPEDRERALVLTSRHNETGEPFLMEYRLRARDGRTVWVRDEAVMVRRDDGSFLHSQGIMQDITAEREAEDRIEFLAYHDGLTGLPNQAMFTQVARLALARANRGDLSIAVLSLDLDAFKLANDTLGMEGGDQLLKAVAGRLSATVRETDTLARRGADEFLVLISDLERSEVSDMQAPLLYAEAVAGRIRDALAKPFDVEGTEVFVSASIGISLYPDDASDVQTLLVHSESAMIASKKAGPGKYAVSDNATLDSATKFLFVQKLRRAVERQEWQLHYQPIVELATGAIKGVEALVRWQPEDGDLIPPNDFIPLAEELGLIEAIGDWVVDEIVRQDEVWRDRGPRARDGVQPLAAAVLAAGPGRADPRPARRAVDGPEERGRRGDRDLGDARSRARPGDPVGPARAWPATGARRLRDRVLQPVAAAPPPRRRAQDRPIVRLPRGRRPSGREDRRGLHPARSGSRHDDPRGGHRDRGRVAVPRRAGMRAGSGLLLQPARSRRGPHGALSLRDPARRLPVGRRA